MVEPLVSAPASDTADVRDDPDFCNVGEGKRQAAAGRSGGNRVVVAHWLRRHATQSCWALKIPRASGRGAGGGSRRPQRDGRGRGPADSRRRADAATGPGLVHAMLDAGGEAILGVPGEYNMLPLHIAAAN
jgi:hypothetical protein